MPSFKTAVLAVAATLFAAVKADYYINPDSVSLSTRQAWCASELSTCPIICEQTPPYTTLTNTCDPTQLTYGCVCGNGLQPNVSEYSLTLPYFVCTEWGNQCVKACGQNTACQSNCRQDHPCGALNPTRVNTTSTSSTMTATGTGTNSASATTSNQVFSGLAGGSTPTSDSGSSGDSSPTSSAQGNAAPALDASRAIGFIVTVGGLVAGFALML